MEYDCDTGPGSKPLKEEPNSEGFPPVDRRVSGPFHSGGVGDIELQWSQTD